MDKSDIDLEALIAVESQKLAIEEASPQAQRWWKEFLNENSTRLEYVLELIRKLSSKGVTLQEFLAAYASAEQPNPEALPPDIDIYDKLRNKLTDSYGHDAQQKDFEKELKQKFPRFFRFLGSQESIPNGMRFELAVGTGWWPIIDEMAAKIEQSGSDVAAVVIKEKFGALRVYCNSEVDDPKIKAIIEHAESIALQTCETCGRPGQQEAPGTLNNRVTCPDCRIKLKRG